jgi:hypothetical protein
MARRTFPPGRVVVAKVEEARQEAGDDPDRDAYQAVVESVTEAGPKTFIEIVEGGRLDPRELLNLDSGVECDHPATGLVLVRLGASLYGPFTAESTKVDWKRWSLKLQRPASSQYVLRFDDRALSGKKGHVLVERTISLQDRPPAKSDERVTCRYEGVVWAQYKIMETSAERLSLRKHRQLFQLFCQQPVIPDGILSQPIVGNHEGPYLCVAQMIEPDGWYLAEAQIFACQHPALPGYHSERGINQDRHIETKRLDAPRDLPNLPAAVNARILWIERQPRNRLRCNAASAELADANRHSILRRLLPSNRFYAGLGMMAP